MEIDRCSGGRWQIAIGALAVGLFFTASAACSKSEPKPLAQPTPEQVRSNSDRAFDNLKQEERDRTAPQSPER